MKYPEKQGLMATSNRGDTPILNRLRKSFEPQKPKTLEERLAQLTEIEMQWLTSNASMLQTIMYMRTQVGDFSLDYLGLYKQMYPRDMSFKRQDLLRDFLAEVAPLDWEPQPYVKPEATEYDLGEWVNPYDINRIEREAREKYAKPEAEQKEHSSFLDKLAQSESSGRSDAEYTTKDGRTFTGLYQVGDKRASDYMKATGETFTTQELKDNQQLQQRVATWHIADIDKAIDALGDEAKDYDRDGLRAVAHLGGVGGMKKFVQSKESYDPSDELGTSLSGYYNKFKQEG